jgi:HTH-type transcriptional regulator/antitoxin HigA
MRLSTIKKKAHELFDEASFLAHIHNQDEYEQALETLDALMDDYDNNIPLIEILSASIERWEESAEEFSEFNKRINSLEVDHVVLKTLMEQYHLGVADFPEIGSKSLISKIINNKRSLTKEHIAALSHRFKLSPSLFF